MVLDYRFGLLFTIIFITSQGHVVNSLKYLKYHQNFPPLYDFDDYDLCLNNKNLRSNGSTYCMIYAEIQPQNSSELWQKINEHTKEHKFHYRHDHLFFGLCMERCKGYPNSPTSPIHNVDILNNEITEHFEKIHKRPLDLQMRTNYQNSVYKCLNDEFYEKYNLDLRTYIEYCESPDETRETDTMETIFYKTLQIIIILNILSTLYDYCLKRKQLQTNKSNEYYKINPEKRVSRLLTSFSICRNYYRLTQPFQSETARDLSFLDGLRSIYMLICLSGHVFFIQYQHVENPEFYEEVAKNPKRFWWLNATHIIEIFFVMSGMLLSIKFDDFNIKPETSIKNCLKIYVKGVIFRFLRFFPSLGFFFLINATIYPRLQDGPFWRHVTESNWVFVREKWWKNLFLFNNVNPKDTAFFHTWFLAADWQLFAFYFLILIITAKYPKYKKIVYSTLAVLAIVIPFSISYIRKLEQSFMIKAEIFRFTFFKDAPVYYEVYTPFYTNLGGYLCGIICAKLYMKYTRFEDIRQKICRVINFGLVAWFCILFSIPLCLLGCVLVLQEPSLWSAMYAGFHRNVWIVLGCGLQIMSLTCKPALAIYKLFYHDIMGILGRLSFQIYLWQFSILYLVHSYQRQPIYATYAYLIKRGLIVYGLSSLLGFVIVILVEYPLAQILQNLQSKKSAKRVKQT